MGRRTTRRPGRQQQTNRPSTFFIVAMTVGLILFAVMVVYILRHPAEKVGRLPTAAVEMRTC